MTSSTTRLISLRISAPLVEDLDDVAGRLGITRTALANDLLERGLARMERAMRNLPDIPPSGERRRARGKSADIVSQRLESVRRLENDLFSELDGGEDGGR